MADNRREPGEDTARVPRDMPDQQAGPGEDPWEVAAGRALHDTAGDDVPDTDEAGTGRRGAPRADPAQSEHPVPDEPTA